MSTASITPPSGAAAASSTLEGLPGFTSSVAQGINDAGQVVGYSVVDGVSHAIEWSDGSVINLDPDSSSSIALASTTPGRWSDKGIDGIGTATSGTGGGIIALGAASRLPRSSGRGINDLGQVVGTTALRAASADPRTLDLGNDAGGLRRLGPEPAIAEPKPAARFEHTTFVAVSSTRFQMEIGVGGVVIPAQAGI